MREMLILILSLAYCAGASAKEDAAPEPGTSERDEALGQLHGVLPKDSAEKHYTKFVDLKQSGAVVGTFPRYMERRFLRQKKGGIIMVAAAGALTAGVAAIAVAFALRPTCEVQEEPACYFSAGDAAMITSSVVLSVASIVLYGVGFTQWFRGKSRAKKMKQLGDTPAARQSGLGGVYLSLVNSPDRRALGLAAGFRF